MYNGGLVNVIPRDHYFDVKKNYERPAEVSEIINILKFPKNKNVIKNDIIYFGSYNLKIQPYFGDFDTLNEVLIRGDRKTVLPQIVKGIQNIVLNAEKINNHFITDIKAGRYPDGESIHWSRDEILKGYRDEGVPDFNGHIGKYITLGEAINQDANKGGGNPLLKIDMICPYYDKYIEATAIYMIKCDNWAFYADNLIDKKRVILSILKDGKKQLEKGRFFKFIKRLFASIRLTRTLFGINKAYIIVKPLIPLIASTLSKFSLIAGDLSSIKLLVDLKKKINIKFVVKEIQQFKDRIANIVDLNINYKYLDLNFDILCKYFINKESDKKIINLIDEIIKYIQITCKDEIIEYFNNLGYTLDDYTNKVEQYLNFYLKDKKKNKYIY